MVTGDRTTVEGVQAQMPWVHGVIVKESIGTLSADSISPAAAQRAIADGAAHAVANISTAKPFVLESPIEMRVTLAKTEQADYVELIPGFERSGPRKCGSSTATSARSSRPSSRPSALERSHNDGRAHADHGRHRRGSLSVLRKPRHRTSLAVRRRLERWIAASTHAVEEVLDNTVFRVRPPGDAVPSVIRDTELGELFARMVRMTDGPMHASRRHNAEQLLESLDVARSPRRCRICTLTHSRR